MQKSVSDYGTSSPQGNYYNTTFTYTDITGATKTKGKGGAAVVPTGQTTPVCNIYDMGGNIYEWTTESYSDTSNPYARRGGGYSNFFADGPTGSRSNRSDIAYDVSGFRLTLFM